ncbi:MAG: M23 family metallopeptidase [Actinomycetota bacterium]
MAVRALASIALVAMLVTSFVAAPEAVAQSELDRAREEAEAATEAVIEAQERVDAAQRRLDEAVERAEAANGVAIGLALEIESLAARVEAAEAELDALRGSVADLAIERYVQGDRFGALAVPDLDDPYARARAEALGRFVIFGTEEEIDQFRAVSLDLEAAREERRLRELEQLDIVADLEAAEADVSAEVEVIQAELATLAEEEARWESEVSRLEEEERRRLEELRRQAEAERQARLAEEQARRAAEAARTSTTTTPPPTTAPPPDAEPADGEAAAPEGEPVDGEPAPEATVPPTTAAPAPPPAAPSSLCPIAGATSFSDTWGAPRSSGRRHKGVDMFAARGTPIVAHVSGEVRHSNSSLGGLQYYLYGDDGNRYFGSHLDAFGASGRVEAGAVIGYVGNTGNARWTPPHLHFEYHPGGGAAVNPTPFVRERC